MKYILIFCAVVLLLSCERVNEVRFDVAQPEGGKVETSFPKKLLGTYQLFDEAKSRLIITHDRVIRKIESDTTVLFAALDSAERAGILEDTVGASQKSNPNYYIKIEGDSVYTHFAYIDTLFDGADGDVLKKFKGYYVLNTFVTENEWRVRKLGVVKAGVLLSSVSSPQDLENLKVLTNATSDSVYTFRPTRRQFKKFMAEREDQNQSLYVRIVPSHQKR